ncbi:MAG: hypothetical protein HY796_04435 [Elusimicrobia bacterium]|nr:hypothetical protein [Elusimicrobiota bacterium]
MAVKNKYIVPVILALCGFAAWLLISSAFNLREAWDGPGFAPYFILMLMMNAAAGFIEPEKIIRKGILSVSLQPLAIFVISGEIGSLFPLGLIAFLALGLFFSAAGGAGAFIKKKFFAPESPPPPGG